MKLSKIIFRAHHEISYRVAYDDELHVPPGTERISPRRPLEPFPALTA